MVFVALLTATGQTIATGNSAAEAYNNAVMAGYSPNDFTVVSVGGIPRV